MILLLLFICYCGIIEGQLVILKNATLQQAVDSQHVQQHLAKIYAVTIARITFTFKKEWTIDVEGSFLGQSHISLVTVYILLLFICESGTMEDQLNILKNAIEQAVDNQTYPHPVEASGNQEQYYIISALHLFAHFMFSCWRGKSYIGIWIGDMSSRTLSNCYRLAYFVVVVVVVFVIVVVTISCWCCSSLIVNPQL